MSARLTPAVVFSLLCAAKTASLSPGSPGGRDIVGQSALASWICKGLDRPYYLAARVRWGMDLSAIIELARLLDNHLYTDRHAPKKRQRSLANLAVLETLEPGRYRLDAQRVSFLGLKTPEWYRGVCRDYQYVYETLERWTEVAAAHVFHRQR